MAFVSFGSFGHRGEVGDPLRADRDTFFSTAEAGAVVANLSRPFGGAEDYRVLGTLPAQLALSDARIVRTGVPAAPDTDYTVAVRAVNGGWARDLQIAFRAVPVEPPSPGYALVSVNNGNTFITTNGGADRVLAKEV